MWWLKFVVSTLLTAAAVSFLVLALAIPIYVLFMIVWLHAPVLKIMLHGSAALALSVMGCYAALKGAKRLDPSTTKCGRRHSA